MNVGAGKLGKNYSKDPGRNQPDYLGEVLIRGELISLAGWKKTDKAGETYLFLVANSKEEPKNPEEEWVQAFGATRIDLKNVGLVMQEEEVELERKTKKAG